jgi:hypothetical protein
MQLPSRMSSVKKLDAIDSKLIVDLSFLFEAINALKSQLKPENTASSKKRKAESLFYTEIYNKFNH